MWVISGELGVRWNMKTDEFEYAVNAKEKPATRRVILYVTSSIYDPLGYLSPFVLPAKCLLQDLCRNGKGWDDSG